MVRCATVVAVMSVACLLSTSGCGSAELPKNDEAVTQLKVLGMLYGRYMEANRMAAPPSEEKFVAFLESEPANWDKLAASPQELMTSPRDGQPLVVLYGPAVKEPSGGGFAWIAHEKTGVDGKQLAVNARGSVELKDAAEIAQLFPQP
jgi:hypothetical protein